MIIVAIIALAGVVLVALYAALSALPPLPSAVASAFASVAPYLSSGASLVFFFVDKTLVTSLMTVTLVVESVIYGYRFVLWVAKKIPMFGVSD